MRGRSQDQGGMFSYIHPEKRIPAYHPLRKIYEQKLAMNQEIIEDAKALLVGATSDTERNIDYDALATKVSELTSRNDELDEAIFDLSKDVGVSLIDDRQNERGLLDHLIVAKLNVSKSRKQSKLYLDRAGAKRIRIILRVRRGSSMMSF